jgi:hypothetical protein
MSFHQQAWSARFGAMGDEAEAVFDAVYPKHHKLGLNRPPFSVAGMKLGMRYTPDRMLRDRFVEVMGCGNDQTLKVKDEKLEALAMWELFGSVHLFVYDSCNKRYWEAPLGEWREQASAHGVKGAFPEGKTFVGLHAEHYPSEPKAAPLGETSHTVLSRSSTVG